MPTLLAKRYALGLYGLDENDYDVLDDGSIVPIQRDEPVVTPRTPTPVQPKPTTTALGVAGREALAGIAPGAAATTFASLAGLPLVGATGPIIGGVATGLGALGVAGLTAFGQEKLLPESIQNLLQQGRAEHPVAAVGGSLAGSLPFLRPGITPLREAAKGIGKALTGVELSAANKAGVLNTALGAGLPAGVQLGENFATGTPVDPLTLGLNIAGGALLNTPTALGRAMGLHPVVPTAPSLANRPELLQGKTLAQAHEEKMLGRQLPEKTPSTLAKEKAANIAKVAAGLPVTEEGPGSTAIPLGPSEIAAENLRVKREAALKEAEQKIVDAQIEQVRQKAESARLEAERLKQENQQRQFELAVGGRRAVEEGLTPAESLQKTIQERQVKPITTEEVVSKTAPVDYEVEAQKRAAALEAQRAAEAERVKARAFIEEQNKRLVEQSIAESEAAAEAIKPVTSAVKPVEPTTEAFVPLFITKQQEADLRAAGFKQWEINKMSPKRAQELLNYAGSKTISEPRTPEANLPSAYKAVSPELPSAKETSAVGFKKRYQEPGGPTEEDLAKLPAGQRLLYQLLQRGLNPSATVRLAAALEKFGARERGVTTDTSRRLFDEAGREVRGEAPSATQQRTLREALQNVGVRINPSTASADTIPHEMLHVFLEDFKNSKSAQLRSIAARFEKVVAGTPEYESWRVSQQSKGASTEQLSPEEFLVETGGIDVIRRVAGIDRSWFRDFASAVKTKLSRGTSADYARVLSNKFLNDASYAEVFLPDYIRGSIAQSTSTTGEQTNEPSKSKNQPPPDETSLGSAGKTGEGETATAKSEGQKETELKFGPFSKKLEDEISYKLEAKNESLDEGDIPATRAEVIQELIQDSDEPGSVASEFKEELQDFGIKVGIYKPYTKEQLDNIQTIGRGKKYDFKKGELYYRFEDWKPLGFKYQPESQGLEGLKPAPVEYRGYQEGAGEIPGFHLYNLKETISPALVKGSTVTEATLNKSGFSVPEDVRNPKALSEAGKTGPRFKHELEKMSSEEVLNWWKGLSPLEQRNALAAGAGEVVSKAKQTTPPRRQPGTQGLNLQTETPEFKKWFGNSRVKDEITGKPLVVYHGTGSDITTFEKPNRKFASTNATIKDWGIFFTPSANTSALYAMNSRGETPNIIPAFLSFKKPKFVHYEDFLKYIDWGSSPSQIFKKEYQARTAAKNFKQEALDAGYDSFILMDKRLKPFEYVAFEPSQIKSAIGNTGAFDVNNPDIRYQPGTQGLTPDEISANLARTTSVKFSKGNLVTSIKENLSDLGKGRLPIIGGDIDKLELRAGASGAKIAPALRSYFDNERAFEGKYLYPSLESVKSLSGADQRLLYSTMLAEKRSRKDLSATLPEKLQDVYKTEREVLRQKQLDQIAAKQPVFAYRKDGSSFPRLPKIDEFYFPEITGRKQLDYLLNKPDDPYTLQLKDDFIKHQISSYDMTTEAATKMLDDVIASYGGRTPSNQTVFNAVRKAEGVGLPDSWLEPDLERVLTRYWRRVSKDRAFFDTIEKDHDLLHILGYRKDAWGEPIKPSGKYLSLASNDTLNDIMDVVQGRNIRLNPRLDALARIASNAVLGPLTGVSDFLSSVPLLMKYAPNVGDIPGMFRSYTKIGEGLRHARETGLVKENLTAVEDILLPSTNFVDKLNNAANTINTISGRNKFEQWSRGLTQATSEYLIGLHRGLAEQGDAKSINLLKGLAGSDDYTKLSLPELATRLGQYTQGTYDVRGLPSWIINSQIAPFLRLSRWNIEQTNNFFKHVIIPAKQGDYGPLMRSLFGAAVGGYVVKVLREKLQNKKNVVPSWAEIINAPGTTADKIPAAIYNIMAASAFSGQVGLVGDLMKGAFDVAFKNKPQGFNFPAIELAGDAATKISQAVDAVVNENQSPWEVASQLASSFTKDNLQLGRLIFNWLPTEPEKSQREAREQRRDLRVFNQLTGRPYTSQLEVGSANPFQNLEEKRFKQAPSFGEAARLQPELLRKTFHETAGKPEELRSKLQGLRRNPVQTFPSPENRPVDFAAYYNYLRRSLGDEEAGKRLLQYLKTVNLNKAKNTLIPSI